MTRTSRARGWMRVAVACGVLAAARLPAQTVRVANLQPRQARIPTQPQKRLLLRIDPRALARYGGIGGVQFRLVRDQAPDRSAVPVRCVIVPTRPLPPPRVIEHTGELDFGVLFKGTDLSVAGDRWKESTFYLVAEVAGLPGQELRLSTGDLRRYQVGGVLLVLQPPSAPPTSDDLRQIRLRQSREGRVKPAPQPCWTVS
jgi:hypothetical protein